MKQEKLNKILEKHSLWLSDSSKGERANLMGVNLSDANLSYANLRYANLSDANLRDANLSDANLSYANLSDANLRDANLSDANLSYANLSDANLRDANLSDASLRDANLSYANLRDANLSDANLRDANLRDANLRMVKFWGCAGNMREVKTINCDVYGIAYTSDVMQIGCENHSISEWMTFNDKEIDDMDSGALEWWKIWKPIIKAIIEQSPAASTWVMENE